MKYEKPAIRDLKELTFAEGACATGKFVGMCTANAGGYAGNCLTDGTTAASCNGSGMVVNSDCVSGPFGLNTNCVPGGFATP